MINRTPTTFRAGWNSFWRAFALDVVPFFGWLTGYTVFRLLSLAISGTLDWLLELSK